MNDEFYPDNVIFSDDNPGNITCKTHQNVKCDECKNKEECEINV